MEQQYSISFNSFLNWLTLMFGMVVNNNDGERLSAGALFYELLAEGEADLNQALQAWEREVCPLPPWITFTCAVHNDQMYHSWNEWLDSVRVTILNH